MSARSETLTRMAIKHSLAAVTATSTLAIVTVVLTAETVRGTRALVLIFGAVLLAVVSVVMTLSAVGAMIRIEEEES